jgi:(1->4)-alpha-D-glucan 1-alpha-D-glucosylmutase
VGVRASELLTSFRDGRVKLHVLRAGLRLRRDMATTFIEGDYVPIDTGEDVIAFARNHAAGSVVCAVTRRPHHVTGGLVPFAVGDVWRDRILALPRGHWRDVLTGKEHVIESAGLRAAELFDALPVALLAPA